jgi:hypothetical protein
MINRIIVELETPGDSRTMFRLMINDKAVGEGLTAVQAHILVGDILNRVTLPGAAPRNVHHKERDALNPAQ